MVLDKEKLELEKEWQAFEQKVLEVHGTDFQPLVSALGDRDAAGVFLCLQILQDNNCFRTRIPGRKVVWEGTCEMYYG